MARSLTVAVATMVMLFSLLLVLYQAGTGLGRMDGEIPFDPTHKWDTRTAGQQYLLGVGKADITGPVVELNLMGYANSSQIGSGLRQRLYSRAFIIGDPANPADRFVYMVLDTQSGDTATRNGILEGVAALGSGYSVYGQSNIAVTGTHNHNGPGAWLNYLLPTITSLGFDKQSYQAIVDGGVLSIRRAHESLALGTLSYGTVSIDGANINRSPYAYNANPAAERAKFTSDVDKSMSVLQFTRSSDSKDVGILTWFPVHGTSMYGNNTIVAGDNKGVAADLFEKSVKDLATAADGFVAGFSQSNVGDTSPNTGGAYCEDGTNVQCTYEFSLCSGVTENCHGRGPNYTIPDRGATSAYTIGKLQYNAARSLYDSGDMKPINGGTVKAFHTFHDMSFWNFTLPNGTIAQTCPAALGYGFAGGTSDWPGSFDFKQGNNGSDGGTSANPLWRAVSFALRDPTPEQKKCQGTKPILLDVGEMNVPYAWTPNIVDIQVLRVGQLFMIISPGEATTMAGRRWKSAVDTAARSLTGSDEPLVVLGGPANSYTHYIATTEEYGIQRYEGASTLYGPYTLPAYINLTTTYLPYLSSAPPSTPLVAGPSPPDNRNKALSFISPVVWDTGSFGTIQTDAPKTANPGQVISATFAGANPRNNLRLEDSYAYIQRQDTNNNGKWINYKDDSDWELVFNWARSNSVVGTSSVTLEWFIPDDVPKGKYRFAYFGTSKTPVTGSLREFSGYSGIITI